MRDETRGERDEYYFSGSLRTPSRTARLSPSVSRLLLRAGKRIYDAQAFKSAEIAIAGDEFRDAMLQAQDGNMSIVDQVAGGICLANHFTEQGSVALCFGEEQERRRSQQTAQISERDFQRNGRMKNARVSNDSEELVNAGPRDGPRSRSLGEVLDQRESRGVVRVRLHFGEYQDVRIDGLHRSPPIHQVKKSISVHEINSRHFAGLPALEAQLVRWASRRRQRLPQQVVCHGLEGAALFRRFLLQSTEKLVVNRQGGSPHMQKHTTGASRCQGEERRPRGR